MKNIWSNFPGDLIFCVPKKAGSTSLDQFFAMTLDFNDYMSWKIRTVLPPKERLLASTRMMVIRHPFHRLASAFQYIFRYSVEEVEDNYFEHLAAVFLSEGIIQHLRPNSTDPRVSFSEFVSFILDEKKNGGFSQLIHQKGRERFPGVKHTLDSKKMVLAGAWSEFTQHWQSINSFCSPCALLPHLVLEVDNLSQELPFALDWSGLTRAYGNFPKLPQDNAGKIKGKTLAKNVLRELTQSQLIGLVGAYSEDLILGGYNDPLVS